MVPRKRTPRFEIPSQGTLVAAALLVAVLAILSLRSTPPAPPRLLAFSGPLGTREEGCPQGCSSQKPGCDIKGNISYRKGERIYHLPGQEYYDKTVISPEKGERWFCTEEEAVRNGWRRSKR